MLLPQRVTLPQGLLMSFHNPPPPLSFFPRTPSIHHSYPSLHLSFLPPIHHSYPSLHPPFLPLHPSFLYSTPPSIHHSYPPSIHHFYPSLHPSFITPALIRLSKIWKNLIRCRHLDHIFYLITRETISWFWFSLW